MKQLLRKRKKAWGEKRPFSWPKFWYQTRLALLMVVGAGMAAIGYAMFQVPFNIAAGGVSGISIILNHYIGWPVGLLFWLLNLPLLVLGFFYLGRWSFLLRTLVAATIFSIATDLFWHCHIEIQQAIICFYMAFSSSGIYRDCGVVYNQFFHF